MLKIKEGVELKELEKYGFRPKYDEYTGKIKSYTKGLYLLENIEIGAETRRLNMLRGNDEVIDIVYDLIHDGVLVKVDE